MATVVVPDVVRSTARANGADAWLAGLPELVDRLERDWEIAVGPAYPDATEAYVAAATLADGTPAVLKLLIRRGHGRHFAGGGFSPVRVEEPAASDGTPRWRAEFRRDAP